MVLPKPYTSEDFIQIGREASDAVGAPLSLWYEDDFRFTEREELELFGREICTLIAKAEKIIELELNNETPFSQRERSLRALLKKTLAWKREYIAEMQRWCDPSVDPPNYNIAGSEYAYNFGMLARRNQKVHQEETRSKINCMVWDLIDQIREIEYLKCTARGFRYFVQHDLTIVFEGFFFPQKPGYTYSDVDGRYSGPFLRLARYVLTLAKAELSDAAICKAIQKGREQK